MHLQLKDGEKFERTDTDIWHECVCVRVCIFHVAIDTGNGVEEKRESKVEKQNAVESKVKMADVDQLHEGECQWES